MSVPSKYQIPEGFKPLVSDGYVSLSDQSVQTPVKVLRDTGSGQSLLLDSVLPFSQESLDTRVTIKGVELGNLQVPVHKVNLVSEFVTGPVAFGIRPALPVPGVSLILGNDLAGDKVFPQLCMSAKPVVQPTTEVLEEKYPGIFLCCAVTRAMSKKIESTQEENDPFHLCDSFLVKTVYPNPERDSQDVGFGVDMSKSLPQTVTRQKLIDLQEQDVDLQALFSRAVPENESADSAVCFYLKSGLLMRKWRSPDALPDEEWRSVFQIVLPLQCRQEIMSMAHETPMGGHLGVNKTHSKMFQHFYCNDREVLLR